MEVEISYARIETEISDYRSGTKKKEEDMFGMLTKKLTENKMEIELLTFKGVINCTSKIEGLEKLDITTVLSDGSEKVMSETRALNHEYRESVGKRGIPENGVVVDAVQVEIDDRTMSLKIVKEEKSGNVMAVLKEIHIPISEIEYLEQKSKHL
jgi:hypothetical protein